MKISKTQWYSAEHYGATRKEFDALFRTGKLARRRTTTDGGETWIYCYRGKA